MELFKNIKKTIIKCEQGGLFHIFGSSVLSEIGGLISSIVVIRHLPKLLYGQYVDANNLYSYLAVFIGFGLGSAVMQYCNEPIDSNEKNAIYRFSFRAGMLFNIVLGIITVFFAFLKQQAGHSDVAYYLILMSALPLATYLTTLTQIILRVRRANKLYSATNVILTVARVVGNILFTYLWSVTGLIFSTYASYIVSTVGAVACLKRDGFFTSYAVKKVDLPTKRKWEIARYAIICAVTNFTSTMLSLLDITCLGIVLSDSTVLADYHVAAVIPSACMFIPAGLITYLYPHMVEKCAMGRVEAYQETKRLLRVFLIVTAIITLCCILIGPFAIRIIYGEKYANVIPVFRILCLNFFVFGGIRKILGNTLAALKKVNINFIHTSLTGVLNIVLNLALIPRYGAIGAAIATVMATTIVAVLELSYLYRYFKKSNV